MNVTLCRDQEREEILREIERRFGIPPQAFEDKLLVIRGKKEVWVASEQCVEVELDQFLRTGIPLLRWTKQGFRLTSSAVRAFGHLATKGVVEISLEDRELAERFSRGEDIPLRLLRFHKENLPQKGQVIVRWRGHPLGSGLLQEDRVKNQVPVKMRVRGRI